MACRAGQRTAAHSNASLLSQKQLAIDWNTSCRSRQSLRQALLPVRGDRSIRGPGWCRVSHPRYAELNARRSARPSRASPSDRADAGSHHRGHPTGRPEAGKTKSEAADDGADEGVVAGRIQYANSCAAERCRDRAAAQSRHQVPCGQAMPDRSLRAASQSGGLAGPAASGRDLVDPIAVYLLGGEF